MMAYLGHRPGISYSARRLTLLKLGNLLLLLLLTYPHDRSWAPYMGWKVVIG